MSAGIRDELPQVGKAPGLIMSLRGFPREVWILYFGTFLNKFGTFVMPFLTLYLTRNGFSTREAAIALGVYGVGQFAASALGGYLADRVGRRKTIVLSMFSAAGTMLLLSQAQSFGALAIMIFAAGLTGELYRPASSALLADLVPPSQRVTAYAGYRLALNAGFAFGPAAAGFLAKNSYLWLFVGDALTSMLYGLVAWFALPHGQRSKVEESGWGEAAHVMMRDRQFQRMLLASAPIAFVFFQMSSTFGLHVTSFGIPDTGYGVLLSLNGLLIVVLELAMTSFTQRFRATRVMAVGYVLIGFGFALNAFATTVPTLAIAMTIFTFGEMTAMPVAGAYVANLAPLNMRGR
ncbi:MAG TPA: MFS transporter, partial [Verrucomicrobiae bacterium]|nr:MFS transporter [Verrucomicrobiae bacterium]